MNGRLFITRTYYEELKTDFYILESFYHMAAFALLAEATFVHIVI